MRKIYLLAATAAIAMSSCTKNEISDVANPNDNPNVIGLNIGSFATKAGETTTSSLNAENQSVTIVSSANAFGTSGSLTFTCDASGDWAQAESGQATWANVFDGTSATAFYSMHTGAANHTVTVADGSAQGSEFTVKNTVAEQEDLIYYAAELSAIPSGGKISAVFNHALSRVKMTQTAATGDNAFVAPADQITLKNVTSNGKPVLATTPSITWNAATTPATYSYTYAPGTTTTDMYLIPQTTAYDDTKAAAEAGTYVESLFYTTTGNPATPFAGYSSVAEYQKVYPTATVKKGVDDYTDAMYVKGAFPLAQTFEAGKYYSLNLNYFGAGIVVAANGFFDAEGNELTVANGEEPDIDDPVNPDENTVIGLTVVVNAWPAVDDTAVPAEPEV